MGALAVKCTSVPRRTQDEWQSLTGRYCPENLTKIRAHPKIVNGATSNPSGNISVLGDRAGLCRWFRTAPRGENGSTQQ